MQELTLFDAVQVPAPEPPPGLNYHIAQSMEQLDEILSKAQDSILSLDLETTGFNPYSDAIVGISLSWEEKTACYVPVGHRKGKNLPLDAVRGMIKKKLQNARLVFHNAKFDWKFLKTNGMEVPVFSDTMILAYLIDAGQSVALKECSRRYFKESMTHFQELFEKGEAQNFSNLAPEEGYLYACADADITRRLYFYLAPQVDDRAFLRDTDMRLVTVLAEAELAGISVDAGAMDALYEKAQKEIQFLRDTSKDAVKLKAVDKICAVVLDAFRKPLDAVSGKIYPNWFQCSAKTTRLSARDLAFEETKEEKESPGYSRFTFLAPGENALAFAVEFPELESRLFYFIFKDEEFSPGKPAVREIFSGVADVESFVKQFSVKGKNVFEKLMEEVRNGNRARNVFGRWCPLETFILSAPESRKAVESVRSVLRAAAWDAVRFSIVKVSEAMKEQNAGGHFAFAAEWKAVFSAHRETDIALLAQKVDAALQETLMERVSVSYNLTAGNAFHVTQKIIPEALCVKIIFKEKPSSGRMDMLKEWLLSHPGNYPVYLQVSEKTVSLGDKYKVECGGALLEELQSVLSPSGKIIRTMDV